MDVNADAMVQRCFRGQHPEAYGRPAGDEPCIPAVLVSGPDVHEPERLDLESCRAAGRCRYMSVLSQMCARCRAEHEAQMLAFTAP